MTSSKAHNPSKRQHYFVRKGKYLIHGLILFCKINQSQLIVWIITCIYSITLGIVLWGPLFRVTTLKCITNHSPQCPDFVVPELEKYKGQLVYLVPLDTIADRIKNNLPLSQHVEVIKRWPNVLESRIEWAEAIAQVGIPASSSAFLVAESGKIIGMTDSISNSIPIVIASSAADLIINNTINNSNIMAAFEAIKLLSGSSDSVTSAYIGSPYEIKLQLQKGHSVYITSMKPVENQVRSLQLILSQTTMMQGTQTIDVRLDRPVIKTAP